MKAISYTAARQNLAKTMEQVCQDHSPIIISAWPKTPFARKFPDKSNYGSFNE